MLTNPILVRAVENPELIGVMISKDIISTPVKDPQTGEVSFNHQVLCGVRWDEATIPAISMHDASQLESIAILNPNSFSDSEEFEDQDGEDSIENESADEEEVEGEGQE